MNSCSHATGEVIHQGHYGSKIDFDVVRCTYGCSNVFVNVISTETKQVIDKLTAYIAPWATNDPARGNAYYWRWDGLNHSTPPIAPNDDDDLTPTPSPAKL